MQAVKSYKETEKRKKKASAVRYEASQEDTPVPLGHDRIIVAHRSVIQRTYEPPAFIRYDDKCNKKGEAEGTTRMHDPSEELRKPRNLHVSRLRSLSLSPSRQRR